MKSRHRTSLSANPTSGSGMSKAYRLTVAWLERAIHRVVATTRSLLVFMVVISRAGLARLNRGVGTVLSAIKQSIQRLRNALSIAASTTVRITENAFKALGMLVYNVIAFVSQAVSSILDAVVRLARDTVTVFTQKIIEGWHAVTSFWRRVGVGLVDLFGQIGHDVVQQIRAVGATVMNTLARLAAAASSLFLTATAPLRAIITRLFAHLSRPFARAARQNVLGVSVTSDDESHHELILFLGLLAALAAAGGWYAVGQSASASNGIDLSALAKRVATFSPEQMTILASLLVSGAFAIWFWIHMLLDSFSRHFESETAKTKWRLVNSLFFVPGAIAYFFKVYNHWSLRQFLGYHVLSVMVAGIAVLVTTSTGGVLWYFNQQASAQLTAGEIYKTPNLELDQNSKNAVLGRTKYGAPLTPNTSGGRIDPFAPIPGQETVLASPSPSPSPSPSASPVSSSEGVPIVTRP